MPTEVHHINKTDAYAGTIQIKYLNVPYTLVQGADNAFVVALGDTFGKHRFATIEVIADHDGDVDMLVSMHGMPPRIFRMGSVISPNDEYVPREDGGEKNKGEGEV